MAEIPTSSWSYRIFPVSGGYAFLVAGKKGLRRSGLPLRKKRQIRDLIHSEFPGAQEDPHLLTGLVDALKSFYSGDKVKFRVKLDVSSLPPFTTQVYRSLRKIGFGKTVTYKELAALAGRPQAARGVGAAMRRNPFAPIVP